MCMHFICLHSHSVLCLHNKTLLHVPGAVTSAPCHTWPGSQADAAPVVGSAGHSRASAAAGVPYSVNSVHLPGQPASA